MDFLPKEIEAYAKHHSSQESELLSNLNRETYLKILTPRMLSGHIQGRVLSMISHMVKPKNILEIGTYTGYSALCLAEGLAENGQIDTIDSNEELKPILDKYLLKSEFSSKINLHFGNAIDIIPSLNKKYDLAFIDADKENYSNYFDLIFDKMKIGSFIVADNVLWSGNVLQQPSEMKKSTKAIVNFNQKIQNDERVENVLMPVRDGLMVIRKISE